MDDKKPVTIRDVNDASISYQIENARKAGKALTGDDFVEPPSWFKTAGSPKRVLSQLLISDRNAAAAKARLAAKAKPSTFKRGGEVLKTGYAKVHKGEYVVTSDRKRRVKDMLSSRNPKERDNSPLLDRKRKWMQGAVKRPGALTKKAKGAGESPMAFAREHYHSSGLTGQEARFAVNAQKGRK